MQTLLALLEERLRTAVGDVPGFTPEVAVATDTRFGDYQTNAAMLLAKSRRANPRQVAAELLSRLDVADISEPPDIAGAGFINFRLRPDFLSVQFARLAGDPRLGTPLAAEPWKLLIDFSSPNIAKPMHVGHIRGTILGDALTRVARFLGHDVVTDNHVGDWGTQFGKIIYGLKHFEDAAALAADPVSELVGLYRKVDSLAAGDPAILQACRDELVKLQRGDPENAALWRSCVDWSKGSFEEIYGLLGIRFDYWLGESFYNDALGPLVERLLAAGVAEVSQGAVCIFFPDDPALKDDPCLIRKSDGGFLYATTDLATIEYRVGTLRRDVLWYVVGAPQQLHFKQLFAAVAKIGTPCAARHIPFGSILGEDRKLMKTRSGDNVPLRDLLLEACERALRIVAEKNPELPAAEREEIARAIGIGAIKYAELSQYRMTDYTFSWERMLSFQGNTAPYLQNAYVRIRSIFRKLEASGPVDEAAAGYELADPAELSLAKKLFQFGETLPQVLNDFRPNLLANYLYELANTFHTFYEACPVLKSEGVTRHTRLALCEVTGRVLEKGLGLLGIQAPARM